MMAKLSRTAQRKLLCLICLGLACRVLIPVGYMPAPLSAGGPVVLCPSGIPAALLSMIAARPFGHHHELHAAGLDQEDAPGGEFNAWESCAFGAAPAVFLPASDYLVPLISFGHAPPQADPQRLVPAVLAGVYRARAPPLAQTSDV